MSLPIAPNKSHLVGEVATVEKAEAPLIVDTVGHRFQVEWDSQAPVTSLGNLVFFFQFLATGGLFRDWVRDCPLEYTSANAPKVVDLLGTILLSILSGHWRYAHINALRGDRVNAEGLGMSRVCSEDSVRRAFTEKDAEALANWQRKHILASITPVLKHDWILDIDVTIKTIYGNQQGAEVSYNPHKPGRPSHTYHTYLISGLRLILDVEVHPGKQHAAAHGFAGLWRLLDEMTASQRPQLIRGDCQYGQEVLMLECEKRRLNYLFRLRKTRKVKELLTYMERYNRWTSVGQGWEATEGRLRLTGWSCERRVVVVRRHRESPVKSSAPLLPWPDPLPVAGQVYEYMVLVTNLDWEALSVVTNYRERADSENSFDELKNQWNWGGFTTKDLLRCQVFARHGALIYNWWSLFVRLANPSRSREAITSRPLLLSAIGRVVEHAGQRILKLTSNHADALVSQGLLTRLSQFLNGLQNTAEQLTPFQCWERIWARILEPWLHPKASLPAPSG